MTVFLVLVFIGIVDRSTKCGSNPHIPTAIDKRMANKKERITKLISKATRLKNYCVSVLNFNTQGFTAIVPL